MRMECASCMNTLRSCVTVRSGMPYFALSGPPRNNVDLHASPAASACTCCLCLKNTKDIVSADMRKSTPCKFRTVV